jgi:preprotein translocase subunit SecA
VRKDREKVIERAIEVTASSLIQQRERVHDLTYKLLSEVTAEMCPEDVHPDEWDVEGLEEAVRSRFHAGVELRDVPENLDDLIEAVWEPVEKVLVDREEEFGLYVFLFFARQFMLREIDEQWIAHLKNIEHLRTGIGLVGYATRNPKNEYKLRGFDLFKDTWERIEQTVTDRILTMQLSEEQRQLAEEGAEYETTVTRASRRQRGADRRGASNAEMQRLQEAARRAMAQLSNAGVQEQATEQVSAASKVKIREVGANDPCPCGSGKRYKKCHGRRKRRAKSA